MVNDRQPKKTCLREKIAKALITVSAVALLSSIFFPYWRLKVTAPQYQKGLTVTIFVNHLEGDVGEVDILNHYIGMRPLREGAKVERELSIFGIGALFLCLLAALWIRHKASVLLLVPVILFPGIFAADLYLWLRDFGLHLNPHAPLSSSIKPFIPPILGQGKIAQFHAYANFAFGHGLSMLAAILTIGAAVLRLSKKKDLLKISQTVTVAFIILISNFFDPRSVSA